MSDVLTALADAAIERRDLQEELESVKNSLHESNRTAKKWEDYARRLEEKIRNIERDDAVMDGWDEKFAQDKQLTITFRVRSGGRAKVVLQPRGGRQLIELGQVGDPLLRRALEKMSGRQRKPERSERGRQRTSPEQ